MARHVHILLPLVAGLALASFGIQVQSVPLSGQIHAEFPSQDMATPRKATPASRIVLYVPEPGTPESPLAIIRASNLTMSATEVEVTTYDTAGRRLSQWAERIEPAGVLELPSHRLPAKSRLVVLAASEEISGAVYLMCPDGSSVQAGPLTPTPLSYQATTHEDQRGQPRRLLVINIDPQRPEALTIPQSTESASHGVRLEVEPMQTIEVPLGTTSLRQLSDEVRSWVRPFSSLVMLVESQSARACTISRVMSTNASTSQSPHPGSAVTIPFLCGGSDTPNHSYCTGTFPDYNPGKIHPALDIDKGTEGETRSNRVLATLPGTVTSTQFTIDCEGCSGFGRDLGNNVVIRHLLADGRVVHSGVGHLLNTNNTQAAGLTSADRVVGGQFLGYKGNTGASYRSHVHFEIMKTASTFELHYLPCSTHWTPFCEGIRTTPATGSTTSEDPAPYVDGSRRALLAYFSRSATIPSEVSYDVYGVAGQPLYGALPFTVQQSQPWRIDCEPDLSETTNNCDIELPTNSGFVKAGSRTDLFSDQDGTDYRFFPYHDQLEHGGGFQLKLTVLPDSSSRVVDNDSITGFSMSDVGTDGSGISDQTAGYYYSAVVLEARAGQWAKWQPGLSGGTYRVGIHVPRMPYGAKAEAIRYKIYPSASSTPILTDPIDHRLNHNKWVWLTTGGGAVQSWVFDSTGYVGLSIDQSGGNGTVISGTLVGVDALKFLRSGTAVLSSVSVSGFSSVNENTSANYTATATFSDGSSSNVTSNTIWSENSAVTTINSSGQLTAGSVTSNQAVTVTATYTYAGVTKSGTKAITVVDVLPPRTLTAISVTGQSSVNENTSANYTATATFSDGSSSNVTSSTIWSENSAVTTINSSGQLAAGSVTSNQAVTVTATYTYAGVTKSGTKAITVVDVPPPRTLTAISVTGQSSVNENTSANYTATATFSDGTSSTVTSSSTWSENSTVTTISASGVLSAGSVTSNQAVTVTGTYTYSGVTRSGTKAVTVLNVPRYTSSPTAGTYTTGGNVLKVKVTFNGSMATFTVAKQDGSAFTTSGVMTLRAGASYGCVANNNTYYWSYSAGTTSTSRTFDLSQYFTTGSKSLYAAIGKPATYCDGTPPTYYSGRLTVTAQ